MPRAVKQAVIASQTASQSAFKLPPNIHLIITTSGGIFSWDQDGVKKPFSSSRKGILAAKEAKDGSQVLAVADEHVIVLHDCKRGREESWGLRGNEVRYSAYDQITWKLTRYPTGYCSTLGICARCKISLPQHVFDRGYTALLNY